MRDLCQWFRVSNVNMESACVSGWCYAGLNRNLCVLDGRAEGIFWVCLGLKTSLGVECKEEGNTILGLVVVRDSKIIILAG